MDHDEHLRQHDEQIKHLVALNVKMVEAIDGIKKNLDGINASLAIVTELLQRARDDDHHNGT